MNDFLSLASAAGVTVGLAVSALLIGLVLAMLFTLSLIHISEPTRQAEISYAVFCLKKKKNTIQKKKNKRSKQNKKIKK